MMTNKDKDYILDNLERIRDETHENNIMLKQIIKVINHYLANHNQENDNDFLRNIMANLISNGINFRKLWR